MAEQVQVREIDGDQGQRLLRIIRRGVGSVVTWRRAQMVLLSAQSMPVARIGEVSFTSPDWVRDVIHNFNADGFESLYPKYSGGRPRTWKTSRDPDYAAPRRPASSTSTRSPTARSYPKKASPTSSYAWTSSARSHPGRQWVERGSKHKDPDREPRRRHRATYNRYGGVRHLFAARDLARDKLYGRIKPLKRRTQFLEFCRYLRTLHPRTVRIAIICDNFSPHLTAKKCQRVGTWAAANNVEIAYTPTNSSWLNRIEAQFTALRYFTLDGTDHADHKEQGSMIRRYIIWRNRHADDRRLRTVVDRANVAGAAGRWRRPTGPRPDRRPG